jgi:hypothetical protein
LNQDKERLRSILDYVVFLTRQTIASLPGYRSFNDPTLRNDGTSLVFKGFCNDIQAYRGVLFHPCTQTRVF